MSHRIGGLSLPYSFALWLGTWLSCPGLWSSLCSALVLHFTVTLVSSLGGFVSPIISFNVSSLLLGSGWAWMEDLGSYGFIALLVSLLSLARRFWLVFPSVAQLVSCFRFFLGAWDGGALSHRSPSPIISLALLVSLLLPSWALRAKISLRTYCYLPSGVCATSRH